MSDDGCYVDEVTVTNTPSGDWNDSTKPKVKVTLGAESGYTFSTGLVDPMYISEMMIRR